MLLKVFNKNEKQLSTLSGFKAEQCLPLLKEKICSQRHLLKLSKKDFIQGKEDCRDSFGTTAKRFRSGGQRLGSIPNRACASGNL